MLEALIDKFAQIEDPRCDWRVEHKLLDILVIAVCAVLGEAESFEDIALYGRCKRDWLQRFLELPGQGRRIRSAGDQRGHEIVVPSGGLALALEAGLQCGVGASEVERDLAEQGQVPDRVALAYSARVFVETDIEYPVEPVLDRPMASDGGRELCWG